MSRNGDSAHPAVPLPHSGTLAGLAERLRGMPVGSLVPATWVVGELDAALAGNGAAAIGEPRKAERDAKPDRLLTVEETAARLGTTPGWIHQHWRQVLPFGQKLGRRMLRFSERALDRYLARAGARGTA